MTKYEVDIYEGEISYSNRDPVKTIKVNASNPNSAKTKAIKIYLNMVKRDLNIIVDKI